MARVLTAGRARVFFSVLAALLAVFFYIPGVFAAPYGSSTYGSCPYQENCPQSPTQPVESQPSSGITPGVTPESPTSVPTPQHTSTYTLETNVTNDQTISTSPFEVIVSVQDQNQQSSEANDPGWVSLYVDGALVGTAYSPSADGKFHIVWDVYRFSGKNISLVLFNEDGEAIARQDTVVRLDLPLRSNTENKTNYAPHASGLQRFLMELPPIVAYTFPYWIFLLLLALALRYMLQAFKEAKYIAEIEKITKLQAAVAEGKDNFLALSSHYLHTPQTLIASGVDMLVSVDKLSESAVAPLKSVVVGLHDTIEQILADIQDNQLLKSIKRPETSSAPISALRSGTFWLPVLVAFIIVIGANLLLTKVGQWDFSMSNYAIQAIVGVIIAAFLLVSMRTHQMNISRRHQLEQLEQHQAHVDEARNTFIERVREMLENNLKRIAMNRNSLPPAKSDQFIQKGYDDFSAMLERFTLLQSLRLEGGSLRSPDTFDVTQVIDHVIERYRNVAATRSISIENDVKPFRAAGNPVLLGVVIATLIDNGIKFSSDNSKISISSAEEGHKLRVEVRDMGIGIPQNERAQLFQPFSRTTSVMQFDYEGLGFSLFLDKLIMKYLQGSIEHDETITPGTSMRISVPKAT